MEEIAWDVIQQVFSQTVKEAGISDYTLQQKIFSNIKKELTCQIEVTREDLKDIIRKAIDKVENQHATPEVI
ncbi:MAG: hypothetical protein E6K87_02855 [Thaumarchaeota archaeon]|nr:MAG: hypothetical protein E6K87_02855 [Nitrososphaerota archaeon]